jgi:hypothetical protein
MDNFQTFWEARVRDNREATVRKTMNNLAVWKTLTEESPYQMAWDSFNNIQDKLRERASAWDKGGPGRIFRQHWKVAKTVVNESDYHIIINDYTIEGKWVCRIGIEFPRCGVIRALTNAGLDTYSPAGIVSLVTPVKTYSYMKTYSHNLEREIREDLSHEALPEYTKSREAEPFLERPIDLAKLLNFLRTKGMPAARIVRVKQKLGLRVDPSEIDDRAMIDLL